MAILLKFKSLTGGKIISQRMQKSSRLIAKADDPDADYIWISRRYGIEGFNEHYTSKVDQYKYKNILENNLIKRKDLSQLRTFTIDPEDAKDFDDAISVKNELSY